MVQIKKSILQYEQANTLLYLQWFNAPTSLTYTHKELIKDGKNAHRSLLLSIKLRKKKWVTSYVIFTPILSIVR